MPIGRLRSRMREATAGREPIGGARTRIARRAIGFSIKNDPSDLFFGRDRREIELHFAGALYKAELLEEFAE